MHHCFCYYAQWYISGMMIRILQQKNQTERNTNAIADEETILTFDLEDTGKKVNMNKPGRFGTTKIKVYYDKKTCLVYIGSIYDDLPVPLMKDKNTQYVWNKTKKSLE